MNPTERRAVISLATIMSLRMLGLFLVLPVFSLYAQTLKGATPLLIGAAIGIYGLFQAGFQIPFGVLSDRFGRKPLIFLGLIFFAIGSFIAAISHSIYLLLFARILQGTGAIGGTLLAFIADLTSESQRTKSMAISGIVIGLSFVFAIIVGPILAFWLPLNSLFLIPVVMSALAILILYTLVPAQPDVSSINTQPTSTFKSLLQLCSMGELARLNMGIFILHMIFTATFVVIPLHLQVAGWKASQQWILYLPTLLIALCYSLIAMNNAEKKLKIKYYFLFAIILLSVAELIWATATKYTALLAIGLALFFIGFSLLEAFLPSLISRVAPARQKGAALGMYSCAQFLGIFAGGMMGGWVYGKFSFAAVYFCCSMLALFWLAFASFMRSPQISPPDFIQSKEHLQSELIL